MLVQISYKLSRGDICVANIIEVKIRNSQTDEQTDRQILQRHLWEYADFFFQLNLLPLYSLCLQGDNIILN